MSKSVTIRVELFKAGPGRKEWWFHCVHKNGNILSDSAELYKNKGDAKKVITRQYRDTISVVELKDKAKETWARP